MVMPWVYIGQQFAIYVGFSIIVGGLIGNGINIFILSRVRTYRKTPFAFYFIIGSIDNIVFIVFNSTSRTISAGFGIDLTRSSVIWCKVRQYLVITLSTIVLTCSCLATIDQFFVTSQSAYFRRLSNIKWAHYTTYIVIIVCCLHGIPCILFYDISYVTKTCISINDVYAIYILVHLFGILCSIPILLMVIFGYMTYRNMHLTRVLAEQRADRQLARMTIFQVILVIIGFVPYGINMAYLLVTSTMTKDSDRLLIENFITIVVGTLPHVYYSVCLVIFSLAN